MVVNVLLDLSPSAKYFAPSSPILLPSKSMVVNVVLVGNIHNYKNASKNDIELMDVSVVSFTFNSNPSFPNF